MCVCECGKDNLIQFLFLLPKDVPEFVRVSLDCFVMRMGVRMGLCLGVRVFGCSDLLSSPIERGQSGVSYVRCLDFAALSVGTAGRKVFPL